MHIFCFVLIYVEAVEILFELVYWREVKPTKKVNLNNFLLAQVHVGAFKWHKWCKEGHKEMKDDFRNERHSISRTEVNAERVRQIASGDCHLTFRNITSLLGKKKGQYSIDYHRIFEHF